MNQPAQRMNYYIAINDAADGPHTAAHIMSLWRAGTIDGNTMICQEGGDSWVSLHEMAAVLEPPAAAPPAPGQRRVQQVVVIRKTDRMKGIRMGALVAALICFFLPWVEIRCSGQRLMYQSGVQTVLNQASPDPKMKEMAEAGGADKSSGVDFEKNELGGKIGNSWLAGGALLAVLAALGAGAAKSGRKLSAVMASVALACLGVQFAIGFPLKASFDKEVMGEIKKGTAGAGKGPADAAGANADPEAAMRQAMGEKMMAEMFGVQMTPWFWTELGLLGLAAALGFFGATTTREIRQQPTA